MTQADMEVSLVAIYQMTLVPSYCIRISRTSGPMRFKAFLVAQN